MPSRRRVRTSIVVCARWETASITEWLLYHRSIGFDRVYLYCNDDDPAELFLALAPFMTGEDPFVVAYHFGLQGQQFQMYRHFLNHHLDETDWFLFIDVDEFLRLRDHSIARFLDGVPDGWDCVCFNWLSFGDSGFAERPGGDVLLHYTRREALVSATTKTMTRSRCVDPSRINTRWFIWHDWGDWLGTDLAVFNVLGDPRSVFFAPDKCEAYFADPGNQARLLDCGCLINHYAFKSRADYQRRVARGIGGDFDGQAIWGAVWRDGHVPGQQQKMNAVEDATLRDYWRAHKPPPPAQAAPRVIVSAPPGPNLLREGAALQSSVSAWSRAPTVEADAAGALSGRLTGHYQFHTELDESAWWQVTLPAPQLIAEIRIFNRIDDEGCARRLRRFVIEGRHTDGGWVELYRHLSDAPVGGIDGAPFIHNPVAPLRLSVMRIRLLEPGLLHLDQVEAYGVRSRGRGWQ